MNNYIDELFNEMIDDISYLKIAIYTKREFRR